VHFGRGVIVYEGVRIERGTRIGDYCIIGLSTEPGEEADHTIIGAGTLVEPFSVICRGATIGAKANLGAHSYVGPETRLGKRVTLLYGAKLYWKVSVGDGSIVAGFCCDRAKIGRKVIMLGAMVHKMSGDVGKWNSTKEPSPRIRDRAKVGMGALIIGPITIGQAAFVAGGAIVTKNVPDHALVVGTRATRKRPRRRATIA
jgi:acetyltransferase-like isoleucine patch superfamily enzyme